MQGKFVCSQSPSTFLFLNRFSIRVARKLRVEVEPQPRLEARENESGSDAPSVTAPQLVTRQQPLLGQSEIGFAAARNRNWLGLILRAFVPDDESVTSIRNVFDLVAAAVVRLREVRSWRNNQVSRHFRVYVAEQRHDAGLVKGERPLLALGPGAEIVSGFLVGADRCPKDVVS